MDPERVDRIVSTLRTRGVMAHRADEGVYEFGVRVVIPDGSEALWTLDAGLDAEVLRDGTLIGYVPHVPGSETFSDEQTIDAIAGARYSEEGLHPAGRAVPRSTDATGPEAGPDTDPDHRPDTGPGADPGAGPDAGPGGASGRSSPAGPGAHHAPWHRHGLRRPHR